MSIEEKVNNLLNKYIKFNLGILGTCTCAIIAVDEVIERLKLFKIENINDEINGWIDTEIQIQEDIKEELIKNTLK